MRKFKQKQREKESLMNMTKTTTASENRSHRRAFITPQLPIHMTDIAVSIG